jgi:hypothetical protein
LKDFENFVGAVEREKILRVKNNYQRKCKKNYARKKMVHAQIAPFLCARVNSDFVCRFKKNLNIEQIQLLKD